MHTHTQSILFLENVNALHHRVKNIAAIKMNKSILE